MDAALPPADQPFAERVCTKRHALRLRCRAASEFGLCSSTPPANALPSILRKLRYSGNAAIEFIHAFSLVHDDLPAMDDDDLIAVAANRRCTASIDEATAILAADALQPLAFQVIATSGRIESTMAEARKLVSADLAAPAVPSA